MRFKNKEKQGVIVTTLQGQEAKCNVVIEVIIKIRKTKIRLGIDDDDDNNNNKRKSTV